VLPVDSRFDNFRTPAQSKLAVIGEDDRNEWSDNVLTIGDEWFIVGTGNRKGMAVGIRKILYNLHCPSPLIAKDILKRRQLDPVGVSHFGVGYAAACSRSASIRSTSAIGQRVQDSDSRTGLGRRPWEVQRQIVLLDTW